MAGEKQPGGQRGGRLPGANVLARSSFVIAGLTVASRITVDRGQWSEIRALEKNWVCELKLYHCNAVYRLTEKQNLVQVG
jgi:hypothetical protein